MTKSENDKPAGKLIPPEKREAFKHELFFGVGTATPPSNSGRFQKGQSGNPKGRPKRAEPAPASFDAQGIMAVILREAERPVSIRDGGEISQISAREAVARALYATAVKGHPYALRTVVEMLGRAEREEAREIAEDNAFWKEYCAAHRAEIEQAKRKGEPVPTPLPHPEDIILAPGKWVRFTGPTSEDDALRFEELCRLRDTLIMQDAFEWKLFESGQPKPEADKPGTAMLFALIYDALLPKRLRQSDAVMEFAHTRHLATSKRALLTQLYQAWHSLGCRFARGTTLPPLRIGERIAVALGELVAAARAGTLDVEALRRGEPDEHMQGLLLALNYKLG